MLTIVQDLLTNERTRPGLRNAKDYAIRQIKGIVVHWTGNTDNGADAEAQIRFFNQTDRFVSAHNVVDDHKIRQCVPDHELAFHAGGSRYKPEGDKLRETGLNPNYFLIGFELCVNADGNWDKTYRHGIELAAYLLQKYRLGTQDLYRHYDITGKDCPAMMLDPARWATFKREVNLALSQLQGSQTTSNPLAQIHSDTGARIHAGPGASFPVIDTMANGALVEILEKHQDWYRIAPGGYISAGQLQLMASQSGKIEGTNELNVRSGPDTRFKIVRRLLSGDRVQVIGEQQGWFKIGFNEWVYGGFVTLDAGRRTSDVGR
jgi:uncharacterized protein YraI